ncbi:IclR family transcriptional regulator [Ochrobactrum sp. XJ1]|nr:IclR family transcriptional regulator [Ochrobactrum sp. XJ1]
MASLDKVFKLIDVLASRSEPFGLTELATVAGLDKGTTHRLLEALIGHGYVNRSMDSPKYELSLKLWTLGSRVVADRSVMTLSRSYMERLVKLTGETVYLTICDNLEAVYMARIDSPRLVRAHTPMGGRVPLHSGSTGRALLAHLPEEEIERVCERLTKFTENTITDKATLLLELERIRSNGYAISVGEWELSISGVAAPIFGHDRRVVASLGVTGPVDRLSGSRLKELGPCVAEAALELSEELGYHPPSTSRTAIVKVKDRLPKMA